MYHEFCGIWQVAKQRYNLTYVTKYVGEDCIMNIYRDGKLVIRVTEDSHGRMYKVATDRLKSFISLNEKEHASSSTRKERDGEETN